MKVVITGGAGFVGTNLSRHLLAHGHEIKILDDLSSGLASNVPDGAQFIEGSIVDAQLVKKTIAGADAVVHVAHERAALDEDRALPLEALVVDVDRAKNVDGSRVG